MLNAQIGVFNGFEQYKAWAFGEKKIHQIGVDEETLLQAWQHSYLIGKDNALIGAIVDTLDLKEQLDKYHFEDESDVEQYLEEQGVGEQFTEDTRALLQVVGMIGGSEKVTEAVVTATHQYKLKKAVRTGEHMAKMDKLRAEITEWFKLVQPN